MNYTFGDCTGYFDIVTSGTSPPSVNSPNVNLSNTFPQVNNHLSKDAIDRMAIDNNAAWNKSLLMLQDYQQKSALYNQNVQAQMIRDETIEKNRENRELAKMVAYEDGNGFICIEKFYPDGRRHSSTPLINAAHLKVAYVEDRDSTSRIYVITWDGHGYEVIPNNARAFSKRLDELGISILVGRDRKLTVAESILGFLNSKATTIRLPKYKGWNKTEDGWHFVNDGEETIETIVKEDTHG